MMAVAAHPDDIEFMMAGTLLLLGELGAELHFWNLANGGCGSRDMTRRQTSAVRWIEAQQSAELAGGRIYPPLVDDGMILYQPELLRKTAARIRQIRPSILLLPSPQDYMEDHQNTSRLLVTAAFLKGAPQFRHATTGGGLGRRHHALSRPSPWPPRWSQADGQARPVCGYLDRHGPQT